MNEPTYYIIDFDSTFVQVEALDELSRISLRDRSDSDAIVNQIAEITTRGMNGDITFTESLEQRLQLFSPHKEDIHVLIQLLTESITPSILRNRQWFLLNADNIYILSGGFREYIVPVVSLFGIHATHVFANEFIFKNERVIGFNKDIFLSQPMGKVAQVAALALDGTVIVIGDGYTDYEIRKYNKADQFFAFTENISRERVVGLADRVLKSFDQLF